MIYPSKTVYLIGFPHQVQPRPTKIQFGTHKLVISNPFKFSYFYQASFQVQRTISHSFTYSCTSTSKGSTEFSNPVIKENKVHLECKILLDPLTGERPPNSSGPLSRAARKDSEKVIFVTYKTLLRRQVFSCAIKRYSKPRIKFSQ